MANLCAGLPMLLLTMVGGAAADRFDKRKILLVTQYVQICIACGIGLLVLSGKIEIWQVFVFAAILGVSNSFEMPTLSALVPELVGREQDSKRQFRSIVRCFTDRACSDQQLAVI